MKTWNSKGLHLIGATTIMLLVGGLGAWGTQAQLAGAVIAPGLIEVEGRSQVIEHPDGGIVRDVLVEEGDLVAAGDIVLQLDGSDLNAELGIIQGQLNEAEARALRLRAELDGADRITTSPAFAARLRQEADLAEVFEGQVRLFAARSETFDRTVESLLDQQAQIRNEIDGQRAQDASFREQLTLVEEELAGLDDLLERGLTMRSQVLEVRREQAQLVGAQGELHAAIARNKGRIVQIDTELLRITAERREETLSAFRDLSVSLAELNERKRALQVQRDRLALTSPISGIVHSLAVTSRNSVIRPDEPVLFVVPQDTRLVIAARINATDVDAIYPGQDAVLRFSAFAARTTPEVSGTLDRISPDVLVDDTTGAQYYSAYLSVSDAEIEALDGRRLVPGMPVESFIQTESRTPLAYLVQPFTDYFNRAFREE
ncbi:HlyD family type I secretion periplasmic adaptor subunit [Tropicimonas sp. S265A]|uniref:HlyD family type I secretion periplasmic adaptor subunit n=1 Tax=Tropicimonas sp. S265A TaxID=3415134 RepID=UPI003C7DD7D1